MKSEMKSERKYFYFLGVMGLLFVAIIVWGRLMLVAPKENDAAEEVKTNVVALVGQQQKARVVSRDNSRTTFSRLDDSVKKAPGMEASASPAKQAVGVFAGNEESKVTAGPDDAMCDRLKALHEKQERQIKNDFFNPDAVVIPASENDGQPLTVSDILALHEEQHQEMEMAANDPNEVAIPALENDGQAITLGELQALHEQQDNEIHTEQVFQDSTVMLPSGDGEQEITLADLKYLHEEQDQEIKDMSNDLDEIIIPASEDGQPEMTMDDLLALHEEQQAELDNEIGGSKN